MRYPSAQAVLFDLDGTLLDTLEDLARSGNAVLRGRGHPVHPIDAYRTFIGDGMHQLARRIFPEEHRPADDDAIEVVLAEYREAYHRHWRDTTRPFAGIAELLDQLNGRDIPIGVVSNKAHDFTQLCVEEFLRPWRWSAVLGASEGRPPKPDPSVALEAARLMGVAPETCLFVGDSDVDMWTATRAAMHPVGVSWGFRDVDELRRSGAADILDEPADLLDLLATR